MKFIVLCVCINLSLGATIRNQGEPKPISAMSRQVDQRVQRQLEVYPLNLYSPQNPLLIRSSNPNLPIASATGTSDIKLKSGVFELPRLITQKPFIANSVVLVPAQLQHSLITASLSKNYNEHRDAFSQSVEQQQSLKGHVEESNGYKIEKVPEVASFTRVGPQYDIPSISEIETIFNNATRSTAVAQNYALPLEPRISIDKNDKGIPISDIAASTATVLQQPISENDNNANTTIATNIIQSEVSTQTQTFDINFINDQSSAASTEVASLKHNEAGNHVTTSANQVQNREKLIDENDEGLPVSDIAAATVLQQSISENNNNAYTTIATNIVQSEVSTQSQTFDINFISCHHESSAAPTEVASLGHNEAGNHDTTAADQVQNRKKVFLIDEPDTESYKSTEASTENFNLKENHDVTNNPQEVKIDNDADGVISTDLGTDYNTGKTSTSFLQLSRNSSVGDFLKTSEHVQGDHSTESDISDGYNVLSLNLTSNGIESETTNSPVPRILRLNEIKSETQVLPHLVPIDSYNKTNNSDETTDDVILSTTELVYTSSYEGSSENSNEVNNDLLEVSKLIQVDDNIESNASDGKNELAAENADSSGQDENIIPDRSSEASIYTLLNPLLTRAF